MEQQAFIDFIKQHDPGAIDALVHRLNAEISPAIDCTQCGNCCRSLMINVTEEEAVNLAGHLQMPLPEFEKDYLEKGNSLMVINRIPCHFLSHNKCTIYEHRFAGCREFPALHLPGISKRLFTLFMHYERCPIIFEVMNALKKDLDYKEDV